MSAQNQKLAPGTLAAFRSKKSTDSVDVSVSLAHMSQLPKHVRLLYAHKPSSAWLVRVRISELNLLLDDAHVRFVNAYVQPKEELTTGAVDYSLNKINYVQSRFPQLRGDSIKTSVKERLLDTTDIDLKGRIFKTGLENTDVTSHASLMATIIAGAGNSSAFSRGAAPAALITSSSFNNLFPDPDSVFRRYNITVQNHSYGTAVENFYGNEAAAYDINTLANPTLLHVFSAGNSGSSTSTVGPYTGIAEMANLSGNFKQAKNIITVSAVDSLNGLLAASSKGPAYDGRVKPELVAYGEDGSSGAAALVSGTAVLVQDQYRKLRSALPSSYLAKAILINAADDIGPAHVDYLSGYGSLNAFKAVNTVSENRWLEGTITASQTNSYTIIVPANCSLLKATLVWNDTAAQPGSAKALVNDLDLAIQNAGNTWLPWVLSHFANKDSLLLPAQRKRDTLNNVEQITIDNPVPGTYTLSVKAASLKTSAQPFAIAWQFDTSGRFKWTFPTTLDGLSAGRTHVLRWESTINTAAQLSYALNGSAWQNISTSIDLSRQYIRWTVPDTFATAVLKMTINGVDYFSDTFTINKLPFLQAGFNCTDSFLLYWNRQGIQQFQLYELGARYLQPFFATSDTSVVLSKAQHPSLYYAVAPLINNKTGLRSYTLNYSGANCYLKSFYLQNQVNNTVTFFAELGTTYNVSEIALEKEGANGYTVIRSIAGPASLTFTFADSALHRGENHYRLRIRLANGSVIYSPVETVYFTTSAEPVIVYPNPAAQNRPVSIIAVEIGRYSYRLFDLAGKAIIEGVLNSNYTNLNASLLAKGLYIIQILDKGQPVSNQKLMIY